MPYPNSSDVSAGQPTASAHYNNLRKDALYLGNISADSISLGKLLSTYILNVKIEYLATNRLRVPYVTTAPASLVIEGCMLQQTDNVDLSSGEFSGAAATWYIFAVRSASSTSFTLSVNTSPTPATGQRLIGQVYWNGTALAQSSIITYSSLRMPDPDYDSGWFAVVYNTTYTKTHNLGSIPRLWMLFHNTTADGSNQWCLVGNVGPTTAPRVTISSTTTAFTAQTGNDANNGTLLHLFGNSSGGYYRILAWK